MGINFIKKGGSINTSDATATENDIINPKTAYINNKKITGNIMTTIVEQDVSTYNKNKILSKAITYIDTYLINDLLAILIYNNDELSISLLKESELIATQTFIVSEKFTFSSVEDIVISLNEYNSSYIEYTIGITYKDSGNNNYFNFKKLKYDFITQEFTLYNNIEYNMVESHSVYGIKIMKDENISNRFYILTSQYVGSWDDRNCMHIFDITWIDTSGTINDTAIHKIRNGVDFSVFETTGNGNWISVIDKIMYINKESLEVSIYNTSYRNYISHNMNLMIQNNILYRVLNSTDFTVIDTNKTKICDIPITCTGVSFSKDDKYILCWSSNLINIYSLENEELILVQSFSLNSNSVITDVFNTYMFIENINSIEEINLYSCSSNSKFVEKLKYEGNNYNYIYQKNVPDETKVLSGNNFTGLNGEIKIGTMPNNGELSIIPSDKEQIIPKGYTSGGKISAVDITTLDSYKNCEIKAKEILGDTDFSYTPLKYIKSTGTQYINTGITPNNTIKIQTKLNMQGVTGGYLIGNANGGNESQAFRYFNYENKHYLDYGGGQGYGRIVGGTFPNNTDYELEIGNNYVKDLTTGNDIISGSTKGNFEYTFPINILDTAAGGKIYYLKIWKNGNLVRDLIPCIDNATNKICMYDKVSDSFFYNAGTGEFIASEDVELYTNLLIIQKNLQKNLLPENIKFGITILDVTGTYTGETETNE